MGSDSSFTRRPIVPADARRRFFAHLRRLVAGRELVVWGAGRAGELAIESLRSEGCPPTWVADRDQSRQGGTLARLQIRSPAELRGPGESGGGSFVVLASMHKEAMARDLEDRGWVTGRDFCAFPLGSIYSPDFGFLLAEGLQGQAVPVAVAGRARSSSLPAVTLFASSGGSFFFRELRAFLANGLRRMGWTVTEADESATTFSGAPVVIGPHEFFSIGEGVEWFSRESLAAAVLVTTEQPQSPWFLEFAPVFRLASAIVDISPNGAAAWRSLDVPAEWMPLGWYPGCDPFDRIPGNPGDQAGLNTSTPSGGLLSDDRDSWEGRPVDILFVGAHSPRRERILNRLMHSLADRTWRVHLPSDRNPIGTPGSQGVDTATFVALARQSKILLNVHRDDTPFWEWQRIVWRGLWQRALVVTEPTGVSIPALVAGRDFLEAPETELCATLAGVFRGNESRDRADAVRRAGCRHARDDVPFSEGASVLARALEGRSIS